MTNLNEQQFLYHGTAMDVEGPRLLPANQHGKGSYWGDTGKESRGEAANEHAWAHPSEHVAWDAAFDRTNFHYVNGAEVGPRARVYALHPNEQQSPGHDASMPGEIKAPYFNIDHQVDIRPGHQGTFPEVNWNEHVKGGGYSLPGDEDANHPSPLSVQFGHRAGVHGNSRTQALLYDQARDEDADRYIQSLDDRNIKPRYTPADPELPITVETPLETRRKAAAKKSAVRWAVQ